ncbi:MAG: hypothetical protein AAF585_07780, partial [Verrucomicrobiota bacterium]
AGLPIPELMTGRSLTQHLLSESSGQIDAKRDHVLTGMERHVYPNPSRAIRTADFLYIRNFEPASWPTGKVEGEQPRYDFVETPWPTTPGAFSYNIDPGPTKQWMRLNSETGEFATLHQLAFGTRAAEELYDLKNDPDQMQNVAGNPDYREIRDRLSAQLTSELRASGDPRFEIAR